MNERWLAARTASPTAAVLGRKSSRIDLPYVEIAEQRRNSTELKANGVRVGRERIARSMAAAGLVGVSRGKFATTVRDGSRPAPDLVDRNFRADPCPKFLMAP